MMDNNKYRTNNIEKTCSTDNANVENEIEIKNYDTHTTACDEFGTFPIRYFRYVFICHCDTIRSFIQQNKGDSYVLTLNKTITYCMAYMVFCHLCLVLSNNYLLPSSFCVKIFTF